MQYRVLLDYLQKMHFPSRYPSDILMYPGYPVGYPNDQIQDIYHILYVSSNATVTTNQESE